MDESMNFKMTKKVQRIKTGVNGLDNLMEGGFPKGANIVISGLPGTGKSILGMAYIAEGCKNNEKCLYITVEQPPEEIIEQALQFDWNFSQWEDQGILQFSHIDFRKPIEIKMLDEILKIIENGHYNRLVIDSINPISHAPIPVYYVDGKPSMPERSILSEIIRTNIITLFDKTKKNGVTTMCISQKDDKDSSNTIIEYIGDGLIAMESSAVGQTSNRTLQVKKLRKTKVDILQYPFEFTEDGISMI